MAEEQVLEGRRGGGERLDPEAAERAERLTDPLGLDGAPHVGAVEVDVLEGGELGGRGRRALQGGADGGAGAVAQGIEGAGLHHQAVADDGDAVRECLGLGEDVAGEEHAASLLLHVADLLLEDHLHEGVEAGGGLVQDEQLDVRGQRRHQRHLLLVALRVLAAALGGVQLEPLDQVGAPGLVQATAEVAEEVDGLAAGESRPEAHLARHVGEAAVEGDDVAPRVPAEHLHVAGVRAQQAEQHPDRGGLAGAVRAEEAVHLTAFHLQVQAVEGGEPPVRLDQSLHADDRFHGRKSTPVPAVARASRAVRVPARRPTAALARLGA